MANLEDDGTISFISGALTGQDIALFVRRFHAVEALSTPYEIEINLYCEHDGGLAPEHIADLLAATCTLEFGPDGAQKMHGVLREFELHEVAEDNHYEYRAYMVPRFWLSTLTRRSRCFTETSIPDIIRQVLGEMQMTEGTDFELVVEEGDYPAREYVAQFEETDFNFLSRWMERLGLFYFFEHGEEADKLVIADANSAFLTASAHPEVIYSIRNETPPVGGVTLGRRVNRRVPAMVALRDYNWRERAATVVGSADIEAEHSVGLWARYAEHVGDDDAADARARIIAEEWLASRETYQFSSGNPDFSAGYCFTVSGAPVGELDLEYVITRIEHTGLQTGRAAGMGQYSNKIECIPRTVVFRPERRARWPRIDGVISARIDAESVSSAAPVDGEGRYSVVLPYDLYGAHGGKATRRIRKAEPYSGPEYGMHFTLHVGAEVLLAHIGGDPDRPIIVGSVPSGATVTPLNQENATRSAIRTRSGIIIDFQDDA